MKSTQSSRIAGLEVDSVRPSQQLLLRLRPGRTQKKANAWSGVGLWRRRLPGGGAVAAGCCSIADVYCDHRNSGPLASAGLG